MATIGNSFWMYLYHSPSSEYKKLLSVLKTVSVILFVTQWCLDIQEQKWSLNCQDQRVEEAVVHLIHGWGLEELLQPHLELHSVQVYGRCDPVIIVPILMLNVLLYSWYVVATTIQQWSWLYACVLSQKLCWQMSVNNNCIMFANNTIDAESCGWWTVLLYSINDCIPAFPKTGFTAHTMSCV